MDPFNQFIVGVNYWPSSLGVYLWQQSVATSPLGDQEGFKTGGCTTSLLQLFSRDMSLLRKLGLSLVRIFLLWEDFQPDSPHVVSEHA